MNRALSFIAAANGGSFAGIARNSSAMCFDRRGDGAAVQGSIVLRDDATAVDGVQRRSQELPWILGDERPSHRRV